MSKLPYNKPYQSSEQLCERLEIKHLNISDKDRAKKIIDNIGYYRFKAYLHPFTNSHTKNFYTGTSFNDIENLYLFDQELRLLIFKLTQKIEIFIRSRFDQWMTSHTQNSYWYLDSQLFKTDKNYIPTINKISNMFFSSKEEYAQHYKKKYYNTYCPFYKDLPPAWIAIELMSFGNIINLILSITEETQKKNQLEKFTKNVMNIKNFKTLSSWISVIKDIRNYCCHHSRLFNRNMRAPDSIKSYLDPSIRLVKISPKKTEDQLNRIYTGLAAIQVIIGNLGEPKFGEEIKTLFNKYPVSFKFMNSMGFPSDWEKERLFFNNL